MYLLICVRSNVESARSDSSLIHEHTSPKQYQIRSKMLQPMMCITLFRFVLGSID